MNPSPQTSNQGDYERAAFAEKRNDYRHFFAGSRKSVHVWLRRIIGYLLVRSQKRLGQIHSPVGVRKTGITVGITPEPMTPGSDLNVTR